jgi:hypothetical protein
MFGVLVVVLCPDRIAVLGFGAGEHTVEPLARRTLRSSIRKTDAALGGGHPPEREIPAMAVAITGRGMNTLSGANGSVVAA